MCRRWGLLVAVGLYVSSLGPTHHSWATRIVVGLCASSLGHTRRRWALRVVVGPYSSQLNSMWRCWALRVVVGLYASSLGPTRRRWALRIVVGPYSSQLGSTWRRWALRIVVMVSRRLWRGRSVGGEMLQSLRERVAPCNSFCERTSWVSLCYGLPFGSLHPPLPSTTSPGQPTSLDKGRGTRRGRAAFELVRLKTS